MLARVLGAGLCRYSELRNGRLTLYDFFSLLRIADWQDYSRHYAHNFEKEHTHGRN